MADYSHLPPALRPKGEEVKEKQRKQRQQVSSGARQAAAKRMQKDKDRWDNTKQTAKEVGKDAAVEAGMAIIPVGRIAKVVGSAVKGAAKAIGSAGKASEAVSPYIKGAKTFSSPAAMKAGEELLEKSKLDSDLALDMIYGDGPALPAWWKKLSVPERTKIYTQDAVEKVTSTINPGTGKPYTIGGGWDILGMLTGQHGAQNATEGAVRLFAKTGTNKAVMKSHLKALGETAAKGAPEALARGVKAAKTPTWAKGVGYKAWEAPVSMHSREVTKGIKGLGTLTPDPKSDLARMVRIGTEHGVKARAVMHEGVEKVLYITEGALPGGAKINTYEMFKPSFDTAKKILGY